MNSTVSLCRVMLLIACFATPALAVADPAPVAPSFFGDALEAAGRTGEERDRIALRLQEESDRIVGKLKRRPGYRHARKLHRLLHREYFLEYDPDADGLDRILAAGRFNCLSGTLFHAYVARELGYEVQLLETPGHLMLRLGFQGRTVDVETTSPDGFDAWGHLAELERLRPLIGADLDMGTPQDAGPVGRIQMPATAANGEGPYGQSGAGYVLADLEQSLGFAWLNSAWRGLESADAAAVIRGVRVATMRFPELIAHADGVRSLLSKTFRVEYEAGRFDDAYRLAMLEMDVLPERTTSRDRLLATAWKRIQQSCEADEPSSAWGILQEARQRSGEAPETGLFLLRSLPLIAATAVRTAEGELARLAAGAYADAEPDHVESARLIDWVDSRLQHDAEAQCSGASLVLPGHSPSPFR